MSGLKRHKFDYFLIALAALSYGWAWRFFFYETHVFLLSYDLYSNMSIDTRRCYVVMLTAIIVSLTLLLPLLYFSRTRSLLIPGSFSLAIFADIYVIRPIFYGISIFESFHGIFLNLSSIVVFITLLGSPLILYLLLDRHINKSSKPDAHEMRAVS